MLLKYGKVLCGDSFDYMDLQIRDGRIAGFYPLFSKVEDDEIIDLEGQLVIPGMIDLDVHGAAGCDFSDASDESTEIISQVLLSAGVTSYLASVDSFEEEILEDTYEYLGHQVGKDEGKPVMRGIHMRGPFLSPLHPGTQDPTCFRNPDTEFYKKLQKLSGNTIKLLTLAPELPGADDLIREASKEIRVSLGNSDADYDKARMAYAIGATMVTDALFNCRQLKLEEPGLFGAAMDSAEAALLRYEGDRSLHPSMLRLTLAGFDRRLCLVSGMSAFWGLRNGRYETPAGTVIKSLECAEYEDGRDAGSVRDLRDGLNMSMAFGGLSFETAVRCASEAPARVLGIFDEVGSIEIGKRADLTILDPHDLHVCSVIINGAKVR